MIRAGLVLAAGASRRFGDENKLLAPLDGRPLASYAAEAMAAADLDVRIAVVSSDAVAALFEGFEVLLVEAEQEQSHSFRQGVQLAEGAGAERLIVTLADMPRVTSDLIDNIAKLSGPTAVTDGKRRMPPAAFPADMFCKLTEMQGDRGAGPVLGRFPDDALVSVAPELLVDVDRPEDLEKLQKKA